jgi:hypothetical protein
VRHRPRNPLHGQDGVGDLQSVIVGVLITLFIMASSVLSVQALVPWQQDRNAKAAVETIAPAQQAALNATGAFVALDDLVEDQWLEHKPTGVTVAKSADGACWSAVSVSQSGKVFLDEGQGVVALGGPVHTSTCLDTAGIRALVQQAGGPANWAKVTGVLAPPSNLAYNASTRVITWDAVSGATGYQVEVRCGSSVGASPLHKVFLAASALTTTVPVTGCGSGMPLLINVWAADSDGGTPTGRSAGLAATR